jgi:squalene-hopene/tetraprenyl-beta-curcumene cyclase
MAQYFKGRTEQAARFERLQSYLRNHFPKSLHHRAVLLWASSRIPTLMSDSQRSDIEHSLLAIQNADGGWTLAALGTWPRHDGAANDPKGPSDGYATALAAIALCQRDSVRDSLPVRNALQWLDMNERISGRWYTRSLYTDRFKNYLSNMATGYALIAMHECSRSKSSHSF